MIIQMKIVSNAILIGYYFELNKWFDSQTCNGGTFEDCLSCVSADHIILKE